MLADHRPVALVEVANGDVTAWTIDGNSFPELANHFASAKGRNLFAPNLILVVEDGRPSRRGFVDGSEIMLSLPTEFNSVFSFKGRRFLALSVGDVGKNKGLELTVPISCFKSFEVDDLGPGTQFDLVGLPVIVKGIDAIDAKSSPDRNRTRIKFSSNDPEPFLVRLNIPNRVEPGAPACLDQNGDRKACPEDGYVAAETYVRFSKVSSPEQEEWVETNLNQSALSPLSVTLCRNIQATFRGIRLPKRQKVNPDRNLLRSK